MKRENEALLEVMAEVGKHMGKVLYANKWDKKLQKLFKPIHKAHPAFDFQVCPVCTGPLDMEPPAGYKYPRRLKGMKVVNGMHIWCCPESDALDSSDDGEDEDELDEVEEKE